MSESTSAIADLTDEITIAAEPADVWGLVSDVTRMPEWSPQVTSSRLRAGFDHIDVGSQFTNKNTNGDLEWVTHAEIVEFEPPRRVAFRIEENWVIWSFEVQPADGGTLLLQRRQAPDGISDLSRGFAKDYLGGYETFGRTMVAGMRQTLEAIKAAAEAPTGSAQN